MAITRRKKLIAARTVAIRRHRRARGQVLGKGLAKEFPMLLKKIGAFCHSEVLDGWMVVFSALQSGSECTYGAVRLPYEVFIKIDIMQLEGAQGGVRESMILFLLQVPEEV